jgi:DNA invertase Pin-like site-specific DNA recombinase
LARSEIKPASSSATRATELESGRNSERPALGEALAAARVRQVPIVVAKVDRLTRSVGFLSMLLDAGVDVRFADLPQIEGTAGRFMLKLVSVTAWTCNFITV